MDDQSNVATKEKRTTGTAGLADALRDVLANHLGSSTLETDETGLVLSYEEYHPFGTTAYQATLSSLPSSAKRYRFCGKERDEESGLVNCQPARLFANGSIPKAFLAYSFVNGSASTNESVESSTR
jgi:hypothetical protein